VGEDKKRRAADSEEAERQRALGRKRGRGDEDGREEQDGERVLQPSREVEQGRELQNVEGEERRRAVVAEPVARRAAHPQPQIDRGRGPDHRDAGRERQPEPELEMHDRDGKALPDDGEPSQPDQRVELQASRLATEDR
jgi:hypothetical protein